jgi:molybdopterin-containing oxidoreductase family iron-sulfur binding subunit
MSVQLGMLIDIKRCIACATCAVACKVENNLPNDLWYNRVINVGGDERDSPAGTYPDLTMSAYTFACQHCEAPACLAVCPAEAIIKREEDGLVVQDNEKCIGCKLCINACPYTGVRTFIEDEPAYYLGFPIGDVGAPSHTANTVEKCTFCLHRVDRGEQPACIDVCPGRARIFGDLNDPGSDIAQKLAARQHKQLLPEKGTNPSVYFLE